jgi:hypothetical protein
MGKEGPMLHAGSILAVILGKLLLLPAAGQLQVGTAQQSSAYGPCSRQQGVAPTAGLLVPQNDVLFVLQRTVQL